MPRLQRHYLAQICRSAWPRGRARCGSPTTTLIACLVLTHGASALAQPSARFADAPVAAPPSPSAAPPSAAPPIAAPPSPSVAPPVLPPSSNEGWSRRLALSHFERAAQEEQSGNIAQALREYTESLAIDSTLGEAYLRLGALRERMGDLREAELVYSEAARLGDTRAHALVQRSHLLRAEGRSADALRDLEYAVLLEANPDALAELAQHYVEAHAFSAALFTFRRILASAQLSGDPTALETARLEVRALSVLAAETDPTGDRARRHDWVGRSLVSIARR